VAAYVHMSFLSNFTVLPRFKGEDDVLALDVSSNEPLFGTAFHSFRVINAYSTNTVDHSISKNNTLRPVRPVRLTPGTSEC